MPVATASARYLALPTKRGASPTTLAKITSSRSLDFVVATPSPLLLICAAPLSAHKKMCSMAVFANAPLPLLSIAGMYIYVSFRLLHLFISKCSETVWRWLQRGIRTFEHRCARVYLVHKHQRVDMNVVFACCASWYATAVVLRCFAIDYPKHFANAIILSKAQILQ